MNCIIFNREMGKSRAEIQREYRERKKKECGDAYLEKERKRVKSYYIPANELSKKEQQKHNESTREGMRKGREKKGKHQNNRKVTSLQ